MGYMLPWLQAMVGPTIPVCCGVMVVTSWWWCKCMCVRAFAPASAPHHVALLHAVDLVNSIRSLATRFVGCQHPIQLESRPWQGYNTTSFVGCPASNPSWQRQCLWTLYHTTVLWCSCQHWFLAINPPCLKHSMFAHTCTTQS